ncbi:MAG TPA: hypothetical protein VGA22_06915 [Gemmatimonadales bacterium]|jgi:thiosulfate dehydrogenase [quinone] large subunit
MTAPADSYTRSQSVVLVVLQVLIGWHFLFEGLAKVTSSHWTAAAYLAESQWWFKGVFVRLAASPAALVVVDFLNSWGLVAIGVGLVLGLLTRYAAIAGITALALYYVAAPPFVGLSYAMPSEGSYLMVNKVLIEGVALLVLVMFPTRRLYGLDRLWFALRHRSTDASVHAPA